MSKYSGYDDDDFYDEEEYAQQEEDLSPEDQEAFTNAIREVKSILKGKPVTDSQIRDTVWEYYFDVDKSVNVLQDQIKKTEKKSQQKKQERATGIRLYAESMKLRKAILDEDFCNPKRQRLSDKVHHTCVHKLRHSAFIGIPWTLDESQKSELIWCSRMPSRIGLLGGSKLAALAKARAAKRQEAEQNSLSATSQMQSPVSGIKRTNDSDLSDSIRGSTMSKRLEELLADRNLKRSTKSLSPEGSISAQVMHVEETVSPPKEPQPKHKSLLSSSPPQIYPAETRISEQMRKDINIEKYSGSFSSDSPSSFAMSLCDPSSNHERYFTSHKQAWNIITNQKYFYLSVTSKQADQITKTFEKPSPDDAIKNAQNMNKGTAPQSSIVKDMKNLSMKDNINKNLKLDVIKGFENSNRKPSINFVVVGHVDAGKSTLMGRLLVDIGAVDQRTMQKYKKDSASLGKGSFAFAWILDQSEEERRRGVTMDIAMNMFESEKVSFTILDAPGHKDFVPNMIAGASEADFALLVIDASANAFEAGFHQSGQTREHVFLVRSLGVQKLIVAVNKLDNINWSETRYNEIKDTLLPFLATAGFAESQTVFIPCSGLNGDNIVKQSDQYGLLWYTGKTLLGELENLSTIKRDIRSALRLSLTDVFKGTTSNVVNITGRINGGNVQVGETILAVPSNETAVVKDIIVGTEPSQWAVAGDNVQIGLTNIDIIHLRAGDILCSIKEPVRCATVLKARIIVFDLRIPLIKGSTVIIYRGRTSEAAKISKLISTLDKAGKVIKNKPRHLISGQSALIEIEVLNKCFPTESFKKNKDLGRIVLRQEGNTVAAGIIEEVLSDIKS
ncbi:hypothetical protein V1511DRAFT_469651 [Dipodascopsis uninucleata]